MNQQQKNTVLSISDFNIARHLDLNKPSHFNGVVAKGILHYVFALQLEKFGIAEIYFADKTGYSLQTKSGIVIHLTSKAHMLMINLKSYSDEVEQIFGLSDKKEFMTHIDLIENLTRELNTPVHQSLITKRTENLKNKFRLDIINDCVNPKEIIFMEAISAYGEAFMELIESDEIFQLSYFKRSKKFTTEILPKRMISSECLIDEKKQLSTNIRGLDRIALNQIKRFSHKEIYKPTSWAQYDQNTKKQYCISDNVILRFAVDLGDEGFFMNSEGGKIARIEGGFPSIEKLEKHLSLESDSKVYIYPDDLCSLVFALSKIKKINDYYLPVDGTSMSALLKFNNDYFIVDAEAAYYAFRELLNYSPKGSDVLTITLARDSMVLENTSNLKIALSCKNIDKDDASDVVYLHDNNVLFTALDVVELVNSQKEIRITPKSGLLGRLEAFIDNDD